MALKHFAKIEAELIICQILASNGCEDKDYDAGVRVRKNLLLAIDNKGIFVGEVCPITLEEHEVEVGSDGNGKVVVGFPIAREDIPHFAGWCLTRGFGMPKFYQVQ